MDAEHFEFVQHILGADVPAGAVEVPSQGKGGWFEREMEQRRREYQEEYADLERGGDGRRRLPGLAQVMSEWGRR